jgi:hypothetical protein
MDLREAARKVNSNATRRGLAKLGAANAAHKASLAAPPSPPSMDEHNPSPELLKAHADMRSAKSAVAALSGSATSARHATARHRFEKAKTAYHAALDEHAAPELYSPHEKKQIIAHHWKQLEALPSWKPEHATARAVHEDLIAHVQKHLEANPDPTEKAKYEALAGPAHKASEHAKQVNTVEAHKAAQEAHSKASAAAKDAGMKSKDYQHSSQWTHHARAIGELERIHIS